MPYCLPSTDFVYSATDIYSGCLFIPTHSYYLFSRPFLLSRLTFVFVWSLNAYLPFLFPCILCPFSFLYDFTSFSLSYPVCGLAVLLALYLFHHNVSHAPQLLCLHLIFTHYAFYKLYFTHIFQKFGFPLFRVLLLYLLPLYGDGSFIVLIPST